MSQRLRLAGIAVVMAAIASDITVPVLGQCAAAPVVAQQGNSNSANVSLSADGRYMAFDSNASNLAAGDTNGVPDVFVYDRVTCTTEIISVSSAEVLGNGASIFPSISDDGSRVAFASLSTNLLGAPFEGSDDYDVFVRDRVAGTTVRVSESSAGVKGNFHSTFPAISADGSVVAFHSQASNLVGGDTNGSPDVFVREGTTTTRVSVDSSGAQGTGAVVGVSTYRPAVSATGRYVAFGANFTNLVTGDTNASMDIFVHDRQTGATTRASVTSAGAQANFTSDHPAISADGRYVVFDSEASNLVTGDTNGRADVFLRDTVAGTTTRPSVTGTGVQLDTSSTYPVISGDGRYVAYMSGSNELAAGDSNNPGDDTVVLDRQTGITRLASISATGVQANTLSQVPDISNDGQFVAFESSATTLVTTNPIGTNWQDVFNVNWPAVPAPADANLMRNGSFATGTLSNWLTFATPDASYLTSNVTGGVLQFYRLAPPPGTSNQAVVFQETTAQLPAGAPVVVTADIGNSDNVRKRISLLVHDSNFSDLSVCTFWLPANTAPQTYTMRTHTTQAWSNLTVSFYAASANAAGNTTGFYRLDNVSVQYDPDGEDASTTCDDPLAPVPPGGAPGATLILNGDFSTPINAGAEPRWNTFGQIEANVTGGVFQFRKLAGTPAGVLLQATAQAMTPGQILTATFQLGNSSAQRQRATVILHDNNFTDLSACTFWIEPNTPLQTYAYRTFATQAWANATFSVYPATVNGAQWLRLDDVTLQRTPATSIVGTECIEPGAEADAMADAARSAPTVPFNVMVPSGALAGDATAAADTTDDAGVETDGFDGSAADGWQAEATATGRRVLTLDEPVDLTAATTATLRLDSWLTGVLSRAYIEVSLDGELWAPVHVVAPSDTWLPLTIDLTSWVGSRLHVRFVFDAVAPQPGLPAEVWRIEHVTVERD